MPLVRYEIRNEYSLANPELYRSAGKDDPEAFLEGMAMAGLVGVVRQLGDLAEFAAEIFHDLHEEVMATAARGHGLMIRVQQLEAEFPSIEKALMYEKNQLRFAYAVGADWHASIRNDQNHLTQGDLPRFILNSYEECRGPPRLFLLDKFDVAGAGACLKRYTDPSFFKMEWASTELMKAEKAQRQKKARKVKKKGRKQRNGETADVTPINGSRVRYSALDLDRPTYVPGSLMNTSSQKSKSQQVQGYPLLNRETKRDHLKSPLNVFSPKKDKHVPEKISRGFDKKLDLKHFNSSPVHDQVVGRHHVQGPDKSLLSKDSHKSFSQEWEEKPAVRNVHRVKLSDNHTTVSSPESQSLRIIPEMDAAKVSPKFIHGEQKNAFLDYKRTSEVGRHYVQGPDKSLSSKDAHESFSQEWEQKPAVITGQRVKLSDNHTAVSSPVSQSLRIIPEMDATKVSPKFIHEEQKNSFVDYKRTEVGRHYVQGPDKSLFSEDAHELSSQEWEEEPAVRTVQKVKLSDNHTRVSSPESQSSRMISEMDAAKVSPKFIHGEQKNSFVDYKKTSEVEMDDDENDDVASEADNYVDALATMESEMETDCESKVKHEVDCDFNLENKEAGGELHESCAHFSEFADAEATAFYNCDSSDDSSKADTALRFFSNYPVDDASNVESTSYMVNSTSECDSGNLMQNGRLDSAHGSPEGETDCESKMKHEVDSDFNMENKETVGELHESCAYFSEFADAEATAFYNCDSSDEFSKAETALRFFSNYPANDASNVESTSCIVNSTSEFDSGNVMQNGRHDSTHGSPEMETDCKSKMKHEVDSDFNSENKETGGELHERGAHFSEFADAETTVLDNCDLSDESSKAETALKLLSNYPADDVSNVESTLYMVNSTSECASGNVMQNGRLDSAHGSPETLKNSISVSDNERFLPSNVLENVQVPPDENVERDNGVTAIEEKIDDSGLLTAVTDAMCHVVIDNIDVNNTEKENGNRDSFSNASTCAGIDNREMSFGLPTSGSSLLGTLELETPYEESVAVSESLEGIVGEDMKKSSPNVHENEDCAGYSTFPNSNIIESVASSELADGMENGVIHNNDGFVISQANDAESGVLESIKYEASDTQYVKENNGSRCPSPELVGQISVAADTNIEHSESAVESMPQGSAELEYVGPGLDSELRDNQTFRESFLDQIPALESEMDAAEKEEAIKHACAKETMQSIAIEGEENEEPPEHVCARENESLSLLQENGIEGSECTDSIPDMRLNNLQPQLNVADDYGDDQVTEKYTSIIAPIQDSTVFSRDILTADSDSVSLLEKDSGYDIPVKELKIHSEEAIVFDVDVVKLPVFTCIRESSSNKELSDKFIHEETSINDVVLPDTALDSRFTELYTDGGSFDNCVAIDSDSYIRSGAPTKAFNSPPSAESLSEKVHMDSLHAESKMQLPYDMPQANPNASPHSTSFDPLTNSGVLTENVEIEPQRNLLFVAPTEICKSSPSSNSSSETVHMDSINAKSDMHILHVIQPVKPIGADAILDVISPVKPVGAEPILDFIPPVKPVGAEPILDFIPPVKPVNNEPHAESPPNFTNKENFDGEPPSPPLEHIKISFPPTSDSPLSMCSTSSDRVSESSSPERREQSQRKVHELCSFSLLPEPAIPLHLVDENPSIQIMGSLSSHRQRNSSELHISQMRDTENDFEDEESKPFGKSSVDFSPVFYNQYLEPTEGLAVFSGRTAASDADTGSPGVLTNSMSSSPETTRNFILNVKCSSADASPSSSHSRNISLGSSPRSFIVSTPHSPVSVEDISHRHQGLSRHSPVESRAVDPMSSTVEPESDCNWHGMPSSPPEACYKNQDSSRSESPLEFGPWIQTSSTVEPNSECKLFDMSPPHPEACHKNQDLSRTQSPVLESGALISASSTVECNSDYKWHDISPPHTEACDKNRECNLDYKWHDMSPPHTEACNKNRDLSRRWSPVLESGALVLTSSSSERNSECNWNEMPPPPPPPLPSVEWQFIKPHQMHPLATLEGVQPPSPPAFPPLVMAKSSMEDGSPSLVCAMQKVSVEQHDALVEAIASHDKTTLKKVPKEIQPIVAKPVDEREVLLEQIRTKSFNLRRTSVVKHNIPRPLTNINVAAILEKANAIRQAFAGSDEEGDDDWSDA